MGDYTNGQLIIYSCPPEDVRGFVTHIEEWGLLVDWCGDAPPGGQITLGHTYASNDVRVGMTYDSNLSIEAPNSAWVQWLDPKYEYNGDIEMYTPQLGRFYASSDTDGNVIVDQDSILALINAEDATVDSIREGVRALFGTAWREALAAIELPEQKVVREAPRCAWCDELIVQRPAGWIHKETWQVACADQVVHVAEPDQE